MKINFESYLSGELWPAFPNRKGLQTLALLYQLEKSQYLPPEEILENQFLQINEIFRHAIRTVPYYKKKLKAAGFRRLRDVTSEQWQQVPILSRSMVQQHRKDLQSRNIPEKHGNTHQLETSGSTGLPIKVTGTDVTQFFWRVCALRDHFWHQRDFSAKMAAIRHEQKGRAEYPGISSSNWGVVTSGVIKTGPAVLLNSSTEISLQAKFLIHEEPDYFITYPSNLEALARYFMQEGLHLNKLRGVRALGETLGSEVRAACHEAWGVPLVDMYSAQEIGYIALQCPENENVYHVQAENLYVEIVDEKGRPCKEGEIGRVLITTLHNFAMPLLRYEIGDYAEVGAPCTCGRTLPVLSSVMGRQRNMLVLPNGAKSWPSLGTSALADKLPIIRQFQFVQKSLDRIEARLVTDRQLSNDETSFFVDVLQKSMNYPFKIELKYVENIPRSKGGKFEDFVSEVA